MSWLNVKLYPPCYQFLGPLGNRSVFVEMMLVIFAVFVCCLNFAWCYCYLLACGFSLGWFVRAVYIEQIPTFCHPWHKHLSPSYHLLGGFVHQPGYRRMLVANGVSAAQTATCLVSYLNQPLRRVRRWIRMLTGSVCLWKMLAHRIRCVFYHSHFLHVPWAPGRSTYVCLTCGKT